LAFDEKLDQVNKLITLGKEKGYLLYDEVNDLLPSDVHSAEDLDDLLSMFDNAGIEVVESPKPKSAESLTLDKTDEVKTEEGAKTMGWDAKTHHLFLSTADRTTPPAPAPTPAPPTPPT